MVRGIVARHAERPAQLEKIISSPGSTDDERVAARRELSRQPRDASATRLREMAHRGELPGVTKSSW